MTPARAGGEANVRACDPLAVLCVCALGGMSSMLRRPFQEGLGGCSAGDRAEQVLGTSTHS
jgi:hypothetical protein